MKTSKKAFTIVEIMIVVVVFGLIAAMVVPAYQGVKVNSLAKKAYHGERLTQDQRDYIRINASKVSSEWKVVESERTSPWSSNTTGTPQTIVIDGKTYKLVPQ